MNTTYLSSVRSEFEYYKSLAERAMVQIPDDALFDKPDAGSNSIAIIVKHLAGNMRSRWTDFLHSDGEKDWRNRDAEFNEEPGTRGELMENWESGWRCLFTALDAIADDDLERIIYIRNMGHTVTEAINRQLAHYPYHIGQIIYIAKLLQGDEWLSLSVPKGKSDEYNARKFAEPKRREHYARELLKRNQP